MILQQQISLAPLTTFKVGGQARNFVDAKNIADVREAVDYASANQLPLFVLGGGSNLVISDRGWPGLVIRIAISGIETRTEGDKVIFETGAGEEWDSLVARSVAMNCAGIECLSGIPGSCGGTPVQNVGAYGQEVSQTISEVQVLDRKSGQLLGLCNAACEFRYRSSIFNSGQQERYIVLRVTFALTPGGAPHLEYADLKNFFSSSRHPPALAEVRDAVRKIRLAKAMLIVPGDDDCRSAGSFFKNPILTAQNFAELSERAAASGTPPHYPAEDDKVKVSAAWLVEHAGFVKGTSRGAVAISRRHALAIVNRGGATAAGIIAFKNEIQRGVEDKFGLFLTPEPVFVGF